MCVYGDTLSDTVTKSSTEYFTLVVVVYFIHRPKNEKIQILRKQCYLLQPGYLEVVLGAK